ncbi:hypothetical protein GCM10008949_46890 [Deinococcus humi]|nr:hypothetical protein GCM10008949_46890 [Deinococcus humi]
MPQSKLQMSVLQLCPEWMPLGETGPHFTGDLRLEQVRQVILRHIRGIGRERPDNDVPIKSDHRTHYRPSTGDSSANSLVRKAGTSGNVQACILITGPVVGALKTGARARD